MMLRNCLLSGDLLLLSNGVGSLLTLRCWTADGGVDPVSQESVPEWEVGVVQRCRIVLDSAMLDS